MTDVRVQFLAFEGCPLAKAARDALDEAVAQAGLEGGYEEIDILDPETSDELRGWGSPTILVNGDDVAENTKGEGAGCRIYATDSRVPEPAVIVERIRDAQTS